MPNARENHTIVPKKLAHIVLRAKHYDDMIAWYRKVLNLRSSFESPMISFLTYDEEHHRIAFLNTSHLPQPDQKYTGFDHVAFTYANLNDLLNQWENLRDQGIEPFWCINHGPTTSMYFRDPDGNEVELQVDNFPTMEECVGWFSSEEFEKNPIGMDFDPDILIKKLRSGVSETELCKVGSAPVKPGTEYVFDTLPPPPQA